MPLRGRGDRSAVSAWASLGRALYLLLLSPPCRRHSDRAGRDGDRAERGRELTRYTWGTHTAQHYFCKTCGIYTHHRRRSTPDECGVNLGAIEGVLPWEMEPLPYSDGINHPSDRDPD